MDRINLMSPERTSPVQRFTLTEVTNDHVQLPQVQLRNVNIHYEFPEVLPQMLVRSGEVKQQIEELLVQLDRLPQDFRADNAHKYLQLSQLLRYLNLENLHLLYNKFSNKPNARNAFLIGVASVGTLESLTFIKEKVVKEELHELELYWIISLALHSAKPNVDKAEEIADVLIKMLPKLKNTRSIWLVKIFYLGYGTTVYKQCVQSGSCNSKLLEPLHDFLNDAIRENNENKIILALKAIGNAAQPASLKLVKTVIDSHRFSEYLQAVAVQTMARIGKQEPTKVQGILLQIFADPSYNVTVRMMACIGLFETNPAIPTVTAIANVLLKENNLQLVNFAYSHMKAWSNVRTPLYYSLSSACSMALKLLNPRPLHQSKVLFVSGFSSKHRAGFLVKWFMIESPQTMLPSTIIWKTEVNFAGATIHPLEVKVRLQGLKELIWKNTHQFDQYPAYQKIKDTQAKLPGFKEFPRENPLLSASVKFFGQEFFFITNGEMLEYMKTMQQQRQDQMQQQRPDQMPMLHKVIEGLKNLNQYIMKAVMLEVQYVVPTVIGLPFQARANSIIMAQGLLKARTELSHGDLREANIHVQVDSKLALQGYGMIFWGVNTYDMQHGLEMRAQIRTQGILKMNATVDIRNKNFKFEIAPPHDDQFELAMASHEAHTVARYIHSEKKASVLPERFDVDILDGDFNSEKGNIKVKVK
ncbi:vitellogenin-2-like [Lacerta agilis]|uniref:vitellogenin-2-like n=1 Tax=Lacerta agilis TaxID=80427 RepID=UPI001419A579|nr:vitellogenin-2-like [Lacerta agilis]